MAQLQQTGGTHHDLPMLGEAELQRLLERLDDDAHPLRREGEPGCRFRACEGPNVVLAERGHSQGLVFAEVVRHLPVIVTDRWRRVGGTGERVCERTSW